MFHVTLVKVVMQLELVDALFVLLAKYLAITLVITVMLHSATAIVGVIVTVIVTVTATATVTVQHVTVQHVFVQRAESLPKSTKKEGRANESFYYTNL